MSIDKTAPITGWRENPGHQDRPQPAPRISHLTQVAAGIDMVMTVETTSRFTAFYYHRCAAALHRGQLSSWLWHVEIAFYQRYTAYYLKIRSSKNDAARHQPCIIIAAGFHVWVMSDSVPSSAHLSISSAGTSSTELWLVAVLLLIANRIREGEEVVYCGQSGDLESLYLFGSPLRTKDSQYAIVSSANACSAGVWVSWIAVPFSLIEYRQRGVPKMPVKLSHPVSTPRN